MNKFLSMVSGLLLLAFISCKEESKPILAESNGRMNHLLVVMVRIGRGFGYFFWEDFSEPIAGLPQKISF